MELFNGLDIRIADQNTQDAVTATSAALHQTLVRGNHEDGENLTDAVWKLASHMTSPACVDANWEEANVVDGLFAIAKSIDKLAEAISKLKDS